jgi:tetratricopeptide (TPR) repeat protein
LAAIVAIYWPARHGGLVWDDDANVNRPELQSLHGLYRIWFDPVATAADAQYYPVVHTAFWLEHKLWGDRYEGFHFVNIFWHSLAVLLVYAIVKRLQIPGALLAAAIFAVHPVMVESVAWMTEQKNTLSTVLYLSAMLAYLKFDASRLRSRYFLAIGFFALALLAKTATVTFPCVLLVIAWWQRGTISWRRDIRPLLPFFALSVATGLTTIWVETKLVGAEGSEFDLTFLQRFLLAGRDVWFYLGKLVFPTNLSFTYTKWTIDPHLWWQWTFSIAALATTLVLWLIRNRSRGPLAAWLFFCGSLFPVLGFVNVFMFRYTYVADHLQYLPSLGMIVLAAAGVSLGLARLPFVARRLGVAACVCVLAAFATLSYRQSGMYADVVTLYEKTLEQNPGSWMAHNNLGLERAAEGRMDDAIVHYKAAIQLNPRGISAFNNLGRAYTDLGQLPEATKTLRDALALKPNDPVVLNSLAAALIHSSEFAEAQQLLEHALSIKPDYAEAHINLGLALGLTGKIPQALDEFSQAAALNPNDANAQNNWGTFLARSGNYREAAVHYQKAALLSPNRADIQSNLGDALRLTGRPADAIDRYTTALRLQPGYMQAYAGLAQAFGQTGRRDEAVAMAKKSIEQARATNQTAAADYMENWLKQYQNGAQPATQTPAAR